MSEEASDDLKVRPSNAGKRVRASGPILILAVLFVAATFLAWYFTWFGRGLSDADITRYLSDTKSPRHVQHALLQVQQRIEGHDSSAKYWYPQIEALSTSPETEFRLTTAWLMGFDGQSEAFHAALLKLVHDDEPIVRRNAALALVRFNDSAGRQELVSVLSPYAVKAPTNGIVSSTLHVGSDVSRGTLLARVQQTDGKVIELRSPLQGRINEVSKPNGAQVTTTDQILTINSDEESVWETLRGLALIGTSADLDLIKPYANSTTAAPRVQQQAKLTIAAIENKK